MLVEFFLLIGKKIGRKKCLVRKNVWSGGGGKVEKNCGRKNSWVRRRNFFLEHFFGGIEICFGQKLCLGQKRAVNGGVLKLSNDQSVNIVKPRMFQSDFVIFFYVSFVNYIVLMPECERKAHQKSKKYPACLASQLSTL